MGLTLHGGGEAVASPPSVRTLMSRVAQPVVVVTGRGLDGRPVGMTVSSFTSVSADPPLVLFCPARGSGTWATIAPTGRFLLNVLAADQHAVAAAFAQPGPAFPDVTHHLDVDGLPVLDGVVAAARCTTEAVHPGGDHDVVVARVDQVGTGLGAPLAFWHRAYATVCA
jgi:3-hydroxy-9,10-secoandrosta-1,3,5(10)-triene-9,17-dione monooxygenase reductase component